jgi:hypothetical protein
MPQLIIAADIGPRGVNIRRKGAKAVMHCTAANREGTTADANTLRRTTPRGVNAPNSGFSIRIYGRLGNARRPKGRVARGINFREPRNTICAAGNTNWAPCNTFWAPCNTFWAPCNIISEPCNDFRQLDVSSPSAEPGRQMVGGRLAEDRAATRHLPYSAGLEPGPG